jgi:hypothetical protein
MNMTINISETEQMFTDTNQSELIILEAEFFYALNCGMFNSPSLYPP